MNRTGTEPEGYRTPQTRQLCPSCNRKLNYPEDFGLSDPNECKGCEMKRLAAKASTASDKAIRWALASLVFAVLNGIMQFVNLWLKYHH